MKKHGVVKMKQASAKNRSKEEQQIIRARQSNNAKKEKKDHQNDGRDVKYRRQKTSTSGVNEKRRRISIDVSKMATSAAWHHRQRKISSKA